MSARTKANLINQFFLFIRIKNKYQKSIIIHVFTQLIELDFFTNYQTY